ncbi:MAG TPA: EF-hand domain-containing protein [Allosphingosinicella sp.]
MNKILLAGAAVAALATMPAAAHPGDGTGGRQAGPQTRAAVETQVRTRFARADANRDGFITQEEVRAGAQARRGERRERLFERLDADRNGAISRAEFDARPALRGDRGERRGQRFARRGGRGGMAGRFGGRAFAAMDLDRDGRVALAEASRAALARFDRIDADRDGTVNAQERQAARAAARERRQDRRGDR